MALAAGAKLGPYEILAPIGAGGMGDVYKARDTRLNRIVAIKISKQQFTERFEREAQAVAALNHPNICQLYDVGDSYLVLEYVQGVPIAPAENFRKVLDIAVQIADGIAAAHAAGFLHRDLKPGNVLITADGRVKILDFGLVKSFTTAEPVENTEALTLTDPGVVAGTAAYMSPEQAAGAPNLDPRSDQFSFGLILYEMAAGRHPFKRATAVETLAAIVRDEPEPLPARIPAPLRWITQRCLAKDPRERYESSRDLFLELRSIREHFADSSSTAALPAVSQATTRRASMQRGMLIGSAAGLLFIAALALLMRPDRPPAAEGLQFTPFSFEQGGQSNPFWAPDARAVAFAAAQKPGDRKQVYVRYLDSPVATQITHIGEAALPIAWTSSGRIVFSSTHQPSGLWSVSPVGGEPEPLLAMDLPGTVTASVSPDGTALVVFRRGDDGVATVWISAPPGTALKKYEPAPFASANIANVPRISFSPDGRQLLLVRNATTGGEEAWLMPYPANPAKPPHRVLQRLPAFRGTPSFSWMPDNRRIVVSTTPAEAGPNQLYLADTRSGEFLVLSSGTTAQVLPSVSPDGKRLVFEEVAFDLDIVTVDLSTASVNPLIATQRSEQMPAWALNAAPMVYVTDRTGKPEIWWHAPGQPERPLVSARDFPSGTTQWFLAPTLSPDGGRLIYARSEPSGATHLWISSAAGGAPVRLVRDDQDFETGGSWSPDGNWFVYWAYRNGQFNLEKVKTTGQAPPEIVKAHIRTIRYSLFYAPVQDWSPAGDWILYYDGGMKLTSPDGKVARDLSSLGNSICTFARDGVRLFCLRRESAASERVELFSVDLEGRAEHAVGWLPREDFPTSPLLPGVRLTFTPDAKSITYSVGKTSSNLWLIDGLGSYR